LKGQCIPKSGQLTPVLVNFVTVDSLGNIDICWQPSPEPSIASYHINRLDITGASVLFDSTLASSSCFTILAANNNSTTVSEEYAIGAKDSCDNNSFTTYDYHNTIFLQSTPNPCSESILLEWNAYDDFNSGLNVLYNVYVRENYGAYTIANSSSSSTSFNYTGVNQGSIYHFYIVAIENGGIGPYSSSSNVISVNTNFFLKNPTFLYAYTATVVDSQQIDFQFYVDTAADAKEYVIIRALNASGTYTTIETISAYSGMNPMITYSDYSVDANFQSYYYKVNVINLCGDLKMTSNVSRTILLSAKSNNLEAYNTLSYNAYEYWKGGATNYKVYRSTGGIWDPYPIVSRSDFIDTTSYKDDVTDILTGNGEFCYRVVAQENPIGHVVNLPAASSSSNEACAKHTPILFVPNAFSPTGEHNLVFKPVVNYIQPTSYSLTIYDRWGKKMFRTEEIVEGWNGQFNNSGKLCPSGIYVYSIHFISAEGEEFKSRGKVHLLF